MKNYIKKFNLILIFAFILLGQNNTLGQVPVQSVETQSISKSQSPNFEDFLQLISKLQNADSNKLFDHRPIDDIRNIAYRYLNSGYYPIGLVNLPSELLHEKEDLNHVAVVTTPQSQNESIYNPLIEGNRFACISSAMYSIGSSKNVKFILPSELLVTDIGKSKVHYYFSANGNKFEIFPDIPFTFGFPELVSEDVIRIEIKFDDVILLEDIMLDLDIGFIEKITDLGKDFFYEEIISDLEEFGKKSKGVVVRRFGKGNITGCARKPFIFVEGIDFGYQDDPGWSACRDGKCNTYGFIDIYTGREHNYKDKSRNGQPIEQFLHGDVFFDKIWEMGYDIYYLDFENGADFIERNSNVLIKLINDINAKKCSKEDITICGASMGGQVLRYALLFMQKHNMKSCVGNVYYFDSPHKGANMPLSLQYLLEELTVSPISDVNGIARKTIHHKITRPAAMQLLSQNLLKDWYVPDFSGVIPSFYSFQNKLLMMGNFPQKIRQVAIPSGSINGQSLNPSTDNRFLDVDLPHSRIPQLDKFELYLTPGNPGNNTLFYVNKSKGANINKWFDSKIMKEGELQAGGILNFTQDFDFSATFLNGKIAINPITNHRNDFAFINVNSSINWQNGCMDCDYGKEIESKGVYNVTGFDRVFFNFSNRIHCYMSLADNNDEGNIAFVMDDLNRSKRILPEIPSVYTYSDKHSNVFNKKVYSYNYSNRFNKFLSSVKVKSSGTLLVNKFSYIGYGIADDFYNDNSSEYNGELLQLYTSECGAEVEIQDGGVFQLGDNNGPINNKAEVHFRDGSYLHLYKGSKLIIHNGSKLIIESGASLYIDDENVIQFEGPDAVLEIQGELIVKPGIRFALTQNGYLRFANGEDGKSHVKLDIHPSTIVELTSQANDKRLEVGNNFALEWPKDVQVILKGVQIETGNNSSIIFNGPVELNYAEFYGGAKSDRILIQTPDQNDVKINGCYFGNYNIGLDLSNVSHYKSLEIDKCQFEQCNVGIHTVSTALNLKNSSFNGCKKGWFAEKVNYPSEIYYCHFYMNEYMVDYIANAKRAELLMSWVTATVAGFRMGQTANVNSRISIRCSNFKNCNFEISDVRVNMSSVESHDTYNGQPGFNSIHAGKNIFDNSPIQLLNVWELNLAIGKNDFRSKNGSTYIFGNIDNANFNGDLSLDENYFMNFVQGANFNVNYNTFGRIISSVPVNIQGKLANSDFGGCSGSGGIDGDGLKREFTENIQVNPVISCYPNPSDNELVIEANGFEYNTIKIFDLNGKLVQLYNPSENGSIVKVIDVSALPSGLYLLEVSDVHGVSKTLKFSVSH